MKSKIKTNLFYKEKIIMYEQHKNLHNYFIIIYIINLLIYKIIILK